ncbi:hypothetical protein ACJRO7_029924 [Eucalyptus globulus]|uniref:Chaperone protein DnaJ n=1 Tax=Eucalyptus globulus TaxID=34317 RepID=A0ABD3JCM5_EUCGL
MPVACHLPPFPMAARSSFPASSSSELSGARIPGARLDPRSLPPARGGRRGGSRRGAAAIRAARKDHYSTLNVGRDASSQEIKSSYRKLARKYHPDMNKGPGAEEKFKEISAAYEVLSDEQKKSMYDQFGEAGLQGEYDGSGGDSQGVDPFEVFGAFFGGPEELFGDRGEQGGLNFNLGSVGKRALDIRYDLFLSFEESIFGGQREIEVSSSEVCDQCGGTGAKSSSCIKQCAACGGRGGIMKTQRTPFGMMSQVSTCSKCSGDGNIVTDNCRRCGGSGKIMSKRNISIDIPPGVNDGSRMRIQKGGNFDKKSGLIGDLVIDLHVGEKQGIKRDGLNLFSKIDVDFTDAILGTILKVDTVAGPRELQIPSGIQPGETIKLPGMGVPDINRPTLRGDHQFIVNVLIPKDLSDAERELLKKLASLRASTKCHPTSVGSSGSEGKFENQKTSGSSTNSSSGGSNTSSFWNSIKDFLRWRQSRERFASVSLDISAALPSNKPDPSVMISASLALIVIFYIHFSRKIQSLLVITKKKHKLQ